MGLSIERADDRIDICLALRYNVFVLEQNVPVELEKDELDEPGCGCRQFLLLENETPVGTFRYSEEKPGLAHFQRFCILKEHRGKGYGKAAIAFMEEACRADGFSEVTLDAQCHALSFYEECGYRAVSDVFDDAGIPHRRMEKTL